MVRTRCIDWLLTSKHGKFRGEHKEQPRHAIRRCRSRRTRCSGGKAEIARKVLGEVPKRRIATQIKPDGSQPSRTGSNAQLGLQRVQYHPLRTSGRARPGGRRRFVGKAGRPGWHHRRDRFPSAVCIGRAEMGTHSRSAALMPGALLHALVALSLAEGSIAGGMP